MHVSELVNVVTRYLRIAAARGSPYCSQFSGSTWDALNQRISVRRPCLVFTTSGGITDVTHERAADLARTATITKTATGGSSTSNESRKKTCRATPVANRYTTRARALRHSRSEEEPSDWDIYIYICEITDVIGLRVIVRPECVRRRGGLFTARCAQ